MIIKNISLKNVRSHEDTIIDFDRGISVINGRTGCGKSSILMGINYALFGSTDLNKDEIMRRGSKNMLIQLTIYHNNKEYTIIRGLKRVKERIIVDSDNLKIICENKQINTINRTSEVNNMIRDLLNIPDSVKPCEMFKVTSYTKQDEIRRLIEMRKEERQEYIDNILQLSKYKTSFENLKNLNDHFNNKLELIKQNEEFLELESKEIISLNNKKSELKNEIINLKKDSVSLQKELDITLIEKKGMLEKSKIIQELINTQREKRAKKESYVEQKKQIEHSLKELLSKKIVLEKLGKEFNITKTVEEINELRNELNAKKSVLNAKNERLTKELSSFDKLGASCPTCKQLINEKHKKELLELNTSELNDCNTKLNILINEIEKIDIKKSKAIKQNEINDKLKIIDSRIEELNKNLKNLILKETSFQTKNIKDIEEKYEKINTKLNLILEKEKVVYSKLNGLLKIIELKNTQIIDFEKRINEKKIKINNINKKVLAKEKTQKFIEFVLRLRTYVKEIRRIIRQKFLLDFKLEFQKRFEEIRNQEDEYSVEVGYDYEPIAFTTRGEKVLINHLSGGEKTSVALAYRLSLSNLASQMSKSSPSELLILDEPTTGFDSEDIKSLPLALKQIKTIPQIIIVTHDLILKDIADFNINIKKVNNKSLIEY